MVNSRYADQERTPGVTNTNSSTQANSTEKREIGPSFQTQSGASESSVRETTSSFDPTTKAALDTIITQLLGGGTKEQKKSTAQRQALMDYVQQIIAGYTKEAAFNDANYLMALNVQRSMEKNMPAITRSIESAGTSASSMQGLLSQKLASEIALQSGALGAEQAKAYAGTTVNLASLLEALSRPDNSIVNSLIGALNVAKGGTVTRALNQSGFSSQNSATSGRTDTTTTDQSISREVDRNNNLLSIGPYSNNSLLDRAAAVGYDGDLRDIASRDSTGQSIFDYTAPFRN